MAWRRACARVDGRGANAAATGGDRARVAACCRTPATAKTEQQHPYLIEWGDDRFPERLSAGRVVIAEVTLKNADVKTWSPTGGNPVRLGYHYYRNRRSLPVTPAKDLRTDLPGDVAPGDSVTLSAQIALPDDPGNYTLELDLVQEGITWFKEQGSPVRTRWLTVEAPQDGGASQRDGGIQLPVRLFTDIANRLPHSGAPYARRNLNQVKYIVVNHTGANPNVSLDRIAKAHIQRGYPGIAYDFVVDASGQILKVKEMEQVAQPDQSWSEQGVNICLAGNFNQLSPPLPQLDAAGRLCAWLAQNLGMTAENIVGMGELTRSESPGETFYKGSKWKEVLSRQVQLHLAALGMGAIDSGRSQELDAQLTALRLVNVDLEASVKRANEDVDELRRRIAAYELQISELRRQLEAQTVVAEGGMRMHVVINQLPRDARRYVARTEHAVANVVVSHTGAPVSMQLEEIAHLHRHDWPGILYDFVVSAAGDVYQTQPLDQVVDTSEPYIRNSISIAFAGDFTQGRLPTPEQLAAGGRLLNWIFERFPHLGVDDVHGLSDFIATASPGEQWESGVNWRQMLLVASGRMPIGSDPEVERALRGQIDTLNREVQTAVAERDALDLRRIELVEETHRLKAELEAKGATPPSFAVPKPPVRGRGAVAQTSKPALRTPVADPDHAYCSSPHRGAATGGAGAHCGIARGGRSCARQRSLARHRLPLLHSRRRDDRPDQLPGDGELPRISPLRLFGWRCVCGQFHERQDPLVGATARRRPLGCLADARVEGAVGPCMGTSRISRQHDRLPWWGVDARESLARSPV
ncbi:MAG: N-acetylmuramoyl-L-alanine amidase [Anaerolineales bacterium]|nr:N-acetylmuramoyl-L-alanine amidase [Anaerolineales bacterium]